MFCEKVSNQKKLSIIFFFLDLKYDVLQLKVHLRHTWWIILNKHFCFPTNKTDSPEETSPKG